MVMGDMEMSADLLVVGGGPGGYGAAFRAADLGLDVILVDRLPRPGGTCLYGGCIPSKTFLHLSELLHDTRQAASMGLRFDPPQIDLKAVRAWRDQVVDSMAKGLVNLAKRRGVMLVAGQARFDSPTSVRLQGAELSRVRFKHAVIATGSRPAWLPNLEIGAGDRLMNSASALDLTEIPKELLVVGGGYVGLELGSIYAALGSRVTLVERESRLLGQVDDDLVQPLANRLTELFAEIRFGVAIEAMEQDRQGIEVAFRQDGQQHRRRFDRALVAVGRVPNTDDLGLEQTGVELDGRGFILVNDRQQTATPHLFAVGDVVGGVMLAHKATREGRVAAEVIGGRKSQFDARAIPAVVYTDPQIAWCGLTEQQAKRDGIPYAVRRFPWKASGRAMTLGATDGLTKLLTDPGSGRILGAGITGRHAEELIAEAALAIEMGALAEDLALTIHPHPSLSETEAEAADTFQGSSTHLLVPDLPG